MGSSSPNISTAGESLRSDAGRPFCLPEQHQTPPLHVQVPDSASRGYRCPKNQVAHRPPLCISSATPDPQGDSEGKEGEGTTGPPSSVLAKETMVGRTSPPINSASMETSNHQGLAVSGGNNSPRSGLATTSRMAIERSSLVNKNLPSNVINTILAARRPSTIRIYEATWQAFANWCHCRDFQPLEASIPTILQFLQDGLDKGLRPNTLRRQAAAIASIAEGGTGSPISNHPMVRRFLKGATNLRPPPIHRFPTWELPTVLQALTRTPFEPLRTASIKLLTFKVCFLVAVTSARRISELAALSVRSDLCIFHADKVTLRLDPAFIPKINSCFHRSQEIVLPNFCPAPSHPLEISWHKLDVRRALRIYISRTASLRKTEALFVKFQDSSLGHKATSSVIGRWLRACISMAYDIQGQSVPQGITAHSTRSAAVSAAWSAQASVEEICKAATWASPSPFVRHYRIDSYASADATFGRRVLQQVHTRSSAQAPARAHPN